MFCTIRLHQKNYLKKHEKVLNIIVIIIIIIIITIVIITIITIINDHHVCRVVRNSDLT